MLVKISYDEGSTFCEPCDLRDCYDIVSQWGMDEYHAARNELARVGRYWTGGGAGPLTLIMLVREP